MLSFILSLKLAQISFTNCKIIIIIFFNSFSKTIPMNPYSKDVHTYINSKTQYKLQCIEFGSTSPDLISTWNIKHNNWDSNIISRALSALCLILILFFYRLSILYVHMIFSLSKKKSHTHITKGKSEHTKKSYDIKEKKGKTSIKCSRKQFM